MSSAARRLDTRTRWWRWGGLLPRLSLGSKLRLARLAAETQRQATGCDTAEGETGKRDGQKGEREEKGKQGNKESEATVRNTAVAVVLL